MNVPPFPLWAGTFEKAKEMPDELLDFIILMAYSAT
jgi:hypothetical protein